MNNCCFIGRITKDPELKRLENGSPYCRFFLAVDREDRDKNTDFFTCLTWGKKAELVANYFKKGSPVAVSGKMIIRTYQADGEDRKAYELQVNDVSFVPGPPKASEPVAVTDDIIDDPEETIEF